MYGSLKTDTQYPLPLFGGDSDVLAPRDFLRAADQIGAEFVRDAIWSGDRCNWVGWQMKPVSGYFQTVYSACGLSLYEGLAGIALFLAHLTRYTQDHHQKAVLDGALRQILRDGETLDLPGMNGFYSGFAGVAWTLADIGELLGDEQLIDTGLAWMRRACAIHSGLYDVLSGAAGLIAPAIDLAVRFDRPEFLDQAEEHARALVHAAQAIGAGVSWPSPGGGPNLLGYSHGAAGIACALLEMDEVRPDPQYRRTAIQALEYERALYNAQENNWPDLREQGTNPQATPGYPVAWCHGACGIGLSRLRMLELRDPDDKLLSEADSALRRVSADVATPKAPEHSDFTYCHGITGNAEFLLETALQWDRADIRAAATSIGQFGIEQYQSKGAAWPCGLRLGEIRGLMLGLAGIGHFFLRLYDPAQVRGVLLLRPQSEQKNAGMQPSDANEEGVVYAR